jgi:hypothetical protein
MIDVISVIPQLNSDGLDISIQVRSGRLQLPLSTLNVVTAFYVHHLGFVHGRTLEEQWLARTKGLPVDVRVYPECASDGDRLLTDYEEANANSILKVLNRSLCQIRCLNTELLSASFPP